MSTDTIAPADVILVSTSVFTAKNETDEPAAVAIRGNRIQAVLPIDGYDAYLGAKTRVIDCGDRTVLPGFNDNHVHFLLGATQNDPTYTLDLSGCASEAECAKLVSEFAAKYPQNPWVYACGWNSEGWDAQPTCRSLDAVVPDRPVCLVSWDLHTDWVNTKALEVAGITRDCPATESGLFDRFEGGELNGIVHELAAEPINNIASRVPDIFATLGRAVDDAVAHGVTAVGNVFPYGVMSEREAIATFEEIERRSLMPIRISFWTEMTGDLTFSRECRERLTGKKVHFSGLKFLADGISEAHTAFQTEPYVDDPSTCGMTNISKEGLIKLLLQADEEGFSTRIHCIGNGTVKMVLDCFEEVQRAHGRKSRRNAIEHIESCCPEDIPRFAQLGVIPSMQPMHAVIGAAGYPTLLGEKWMPYCWPIKDIMDTGAVMAFSSDYPVTRPHPMEEVAAAVTMQGADGLPEEGFLPSQRISVGAALRAHTYGSAYLCGTDDELGTLEAGKLADVAVMDRNLFACDSSELAGSLADMVFFDGELVRDAKGDGAHVSQGERAA